MHVHTHRHTANFTKGETKFTQVDVAPQNNSIFVTWTFNVCTNTVVTNYSSHVCIDAPDWAESLKQIAIGLDYEAIRWRCM